METAAPIVATAFVSNGVRHTSPLARTSTPSRWFVPSGNTKPSSKSSQRESSNAPLTFHFHTIRSAKLFWTGLTRFTRLEDEGPWNNSPDNPVNPVNPVRKEPPCIICCGGRLLMPFVFVPPTISEWTVHSERTTTVEIDRCPTCLLMPPRAHFRKGIATSAAAHTIPASSS